MALSWLYVLFGEVGIVSAAFFGLKTAVLAIVLQALVRIGSRSLRNRTLLAVAAVAFVAIFAFGVPFPIIILAAGVIGFLAARAGSRAFAPGGGHGARGGAHVADAETLLGEERLGVLRRRAPRGPPRRTDRPRPLAPAGRRCSSSSPGQRTSSPTSRPSSRGWRS